MIPGFTRALFGILVNVLIDPEMTELSRVLLRRVCVWVRYTSPGLPQETTVPSLVRYLPAPLSPSNPTNSFLPI